MTKLELVKEISKETGCNPQEVMMIVEALMLSVKKSLSKGENVYLRGFGSFILKHRAEKVARNISKNTMVVVPEHDTPFFKPCKEFIHSISGLEEYK